MKFLKIQILIICFALLFISNSVKAQAQPITIDPDCGTIGHAPCVPGVNTHLVNINLDTVSAQRQEVAINSSKQPEGQTPMPPSECGIAGLPPCVPGINAPLPPKKTFDVITIPISSVAQPFEVLDPPYQITLANPVSSLDLVISLKPYTEEQQQTEIYQLERKLVPRAYEDPDMYGDYSEFVFEIAAKQNQQPVNSLPNPLTITLPWPTEHYMKKIIHYWDGNKKNWFPLESTSDFEQQTVSALWHLPYGQFAVFDSVTIFEGVASWYEYKKCNCAAIKEFKRGTSFRVTNITDGSPRYGKSVTVIINDYGPAVWTKRLIDLDKFAFRQIANPWNGLATVRVELLN